MKYAVAAAGAALAEAACFDKGALGYHDWQTEPEPVIEEAVDIEDDAGGR